jgi:RNA polymerase sigma factor (sigma-70 family)
MTATRTLSVSLQQLGRTLAARDLAGLSDAELVGRFAACRDEAAFTALVGRYGRVVFGVCRRVLRHEQDAEDAFQATFLVLARNAASVRRAGAVGNWLYGVAYNVARKAKAMRHRREVKEQEAATRPRPDAPEGMPSDVLEILDGELHALPDKYRASVVLCDFRGLTIREAAAEAGCPPKTLGTRLSRGRALLARRLTRRGVAISAGGLAAALVPCATAANLPRLTGSTVQAAIEFAAGSASAVSPAVAVLTQGVTSFMLPRTFKLAAVLACGVLVLGGFAAGHRSHLSAGPTRPIAFTAESDAPAAKPARAANDLHYHIHRFFVLLLAPITLGNGDFTALADQKEEKDKAVLSGTWAQKSGDQKIEFCEKNVLKVHAHNGALVIACDYTHGKEGLIKAKITELSGKEELLEKAKDKLPVGFEFRFKWTVKDGKATLDDVAGDNTELLKSHVEGDYEEKK